MSFRRILFSTVVLVVLMTLAFSSTFVAAKSQTEQIDSSLEAGVAFSPSPQNVSLASPGQLGKKPGTLPKAFKNGCGSVGEPTQEKIFSPYGNVIDTYITMRCGVVYSTYQTGTCGCRAGGWRYTTKCVKTKPVTIYLPCHRHITFIVPR